MERGPGLGLGGGLTGWGDLLKHIIHGQPLLPQRPTLHQAAGLAGGTQQHLGTQQTGRYMDGRVSGQVDKQALRTKPQGPPSLPPSWPGTQHYYPLPPNPKKCLAVGRK